MPGPIPPFHKGEKLTADRMNQLRAGGQVSLGGDLAGTSMDGRQTVRNTARAPRPLPAFWSRIGASVTDGPNRWRYEWQEIIKKTFGYDGWSVRQAPDPNDPQETVDARSSSTLSRYAYNQAETINSASGVQGNGIDISAADFPAGFSVRPVPEGTPVLMQFVHVQSPSMYELWFWFPNPVDGSCG